MAVSVTFNGVTYAIPTTGGTAWGSTVTSFLQALGASSATVSSVQTLSNKTLTQSSPAAPSLANSWVNFGAPRLVAGYWKDSMDVVHLQGTIKDGTATPGTTLFTLPSGYRPSDLVSFPVTSNGAFGSVNITSAGVVSIEAGSNTSFALDGITFRIAGP